MVISFGLSIWHQDKRWLAIANIAIVAVMTSFCWALLKMSREMEMKRPRVYQAMVFVLIGILAGVVLPASGMYLLFR
jgi:hypothetical protein